VSKYRLQLVEPPNLEELGLEPLIDMAFAADLIGMTYEQLRNFLYKNKDRFQRRYRRVYYRDDSGKGRKTKIRVLYPFEIKEIRELILVGPGRFIHNAKDAAKYRAGEKGENPCPTGVGDNALPTGATAPGVDGGSGAGSEGERENLSEITPSVRQSPDRQENDSLDVQGGDHRREESRGLGCETDSYAARYGPAGHSSWED